MAEVPVIVPIGNDITAGFIANISGVPAEDIVRWYGNAGLNFTAWPLVAPMPGVREWKHKRPYGTVETRNITAASASVIAIDGVPLVDPDDVGTWVYIATNPAGQGQFRRIVAISGSDLTVSPALNPELTADPFSGGSFGVIVIMRNSHRVAPGSTGTNIIRNTDTPAFTSADVGKFALFFHAYETDIFQLTRKIIAQNGTSITLDSPLSFDGPSAPPVDTGFVVLSSGDTNDAAQTLALFANGAALIPMALRLDDAPVYADGHDFNGWQLGIPYASPLAALGLKATVVTAGTNTVTVERAIFSALLDVGAQIKVGTQSARTIVSVDTPFQVTVTPAWTNNPPGVLLPVADDRLILVRTWINCVAQLAYRMRARFATPIVVAEFGVIGAMVSPFVLPLGPQQPSWAHDFTSLDFHPSSPASCFVALKSMLSSVKTLIEGEGNTAKFYICINCTDWDAIPGRYLHIGENLTLLRDALRDHVQDPTMPFAIAGPSTYGIGPPDLRPAIYEQLAEMKRLDAWTNYFDNRFGQSYAFDNAHISAPGQIVLADRFADTLIELLDNDGVLDDESAFIVEDGTGLVDANSYCTVEFADSYLQGLQDPPEWRNATPKAKQSALREMARWITFRWRYQGQRTDADQALAFPRFGLSDENGFAVDNDSVPVRVQQAAAYGAYRIVKGDWIPFPDEETNQGLTASSVGVGPIQISETYAGPRQTDTETRLPLVEQLLAIYTLATTMGRIGRG